MSSRFVKKPDGEVCTSPAEMLQCWRDHSEGVLNISSPYIYEDMIQVLMQHPVREGMRDPPAEEKILEGMSHLKGNIAGKRIAFCQRC